MEQSPFSQLNRLAAQFEMFPPGSRVLCAVSGGADSIYLLHRLYLLRDQWKITLIAAHYNHRLRGAESDRDEEFVRAFVKKWCGESRMESSGGVHILPPVELVVGSGDVAEEAARRSRGVEETAREMRYAFLEETARKMGCNRIATAHTADDNAETVLLHWVRGSARKGLAGIHPRRGKLVRPMLTTSRAAVEEYLRLYGLPHVEDSSNTDETYGRNRLRRQVMPVLRELNPAFVEGMAAFSDTLRMEDDYLDQLVRQALGQPDWEEGECSLPVRRLTELPPALLLRGARLLLEEMGPGPGDWITRANLEAVALLAGGQNPSGELRLSGGLRVYRRYERLCLTTRPAPVPFSAVPLPWTAQVEVGEDGWSVACTPGICPENPPKKGDTFYLDCAMIKGRLLVRPRAQGDEITLPGRKRRTIKKLMIDEKIPRCLRGQVPVLTDEDGVLAVAGFGPEESRLARPGQPALMVVMRQSRGERKKAMLEHDIQRVLFSQQVLAERVAALAGEINRDYAGKSPMLISVLRGSFIFMADLMRQITLPCTVDFMAVSSYGSGTASSGQVKITKDLSESIEGRDILVVEDILDSGNTLSYLLQILQARHPASMKLCALLDKPSRRVKDVHVDYVGFSIPDEFVVGYGLDYAERYRNLPYIGILKPEIYGGV